MLEATGVAFEWDVQIAGVTALEESGDVLPESVLDSIRAAGVSLGTPAARSRGGRAYSGRWQRALTSVGNGTV